MSLILSSVQNNFEWDREAETKEKLQERLSDADKSNR